MYPSSKVADFVMQCESCVLRAYKCPAGRWTIGFGHTYGVKEGDIISVDQAHLFLDKDLEEAAKGVRAAVKVVITQNMFDALVSLTFNIGGGALAQSTLIKHLNAKDYHGAADAFLSYGYATDPQTKKKRALKGLLERRSAERDLFLDGMGVLTYTKPSA